MQNCDSAGVVWKCFRLKRFRIRVAGRACPAGHCKRRSLSCGSRASPTSGAIHVFWFSCNAAKTRDARHSKPGMTAERQRAIGRLRIKNSVDAAVSEIPGEGAPLTAWVCACAARVRPLIECTGALCLRGEALPGRSRLRPARRCARSTGMPATESPAPVPWRRPMPWVRGHIARRR